MKVIADLCVVPVGVGVSLSRYVAACERVLTEAGLGPRLHAHGTNVEGEWDGVLAAFKHCHEVAHEEKARMPLAREWISRVGSFPGRSPAGLRASRDCAVPSRACCGVLHEMGAPRITTTVNLGTRVDRDQTMADKIESVQAELAGGREHR